MYVKYECFVTQMLYVFVLCASCGSSQCCVLHDLQFVNAGRGCNLRDSQCLVVGKDKIEVSDYVTILGVTFDNRMTLQKHITNICRSVNMHIRKINSIRRYLSNTAVRSLVQSIVIARLDYCNSICVGLPINRLQRLQQCSTCYKPDQTIYIDNAYPK